jgi:hypothetical protein
MPKRQSMTPSERALRARTAAYAMHAKHGLEQTTAKGRAAFLATFEEQVDPAEALPPDERRRRAKQLRKAYFARLALASAKARRTRRPVARGGESTTGRP